MFSEFFKANRVFCSRVLKPRLYTVSHISAIEWWLCKRVSLLEGRASLLEFGSGSTFPVSRLVGSQFETVCATDIEDVPASQWPSATTFRQCGPTDVPFDADQFDAVVAFSVIEHVAEPAKVFRELARVLRPGGVILMNVPNKWDYVSVIARLAGSFKSSLLGGTRPKTWEDFPVLYRANTRRALSKALNASGLEIEHFRPLPSEPGYLSFFVPFYLAGAVYQFTISLLLLDFLQPSFLVILKKAEVPAQLLPPHPLEPRANT